MENYGTALDEDNLYDPETAFEQPNHSPCNSQVPFDLEAAVESLSRSKFEIIEQLQFESRSFQLLESALLAKVEAKEKELRHFLTCRSPAFECENAATVQQPVSNVAPIQSTVPAVRHVPTLIGGLTKTVDGLLGPANVPPQSGVTSGSNVMTPTYPSPLIQLSSKVGPVTGNRPMELRKALFDVLPGSVEADECGGPYSKVPIDAAVNLVLGRLRRAQTTCNALVTSNQTELQSFTFTQNSQNGKLIMNRIRVLEQENEELASINRTGRAARLETEIALRRRFVQDLKQTHSDLEYLVEEVEAETELFGSSLLMLQQRLNFAKASAQMLASELDSLEPGYSARVFQDVGWCPFDDTDQLLSTQDAESLEHSMEDGGPHVEICSPVSERSNSPVSSRNLSPGSAEDNSYQENGPSSNRFKRSMIEEDSRSPTSTTSDHYRAKRPRSNQDSSTTTPSPLTTTSANPNFCSSPTRHAPVVDDAPRTFCPSDASQTPLDESLERTRSCSPSAYGDSDGQCPLDKCKPSSGDGCGAASWCMPTNGQLGCSD